MQMRESTTDFKIGDAYQTRYESNYDDAKAEMFDQTGCIEREFEFKLPQDTDIVVCEWNDVELVASKKTELRDLVECFVYFDVGNNEIQYNFLEVYNEYLLDAWGVKL